MKKGYINEYGENISELDITTCLKRIRKLPPESIDELYHLCDYIIEDHDKPFKALRFLDVEGIRENLDSGKAIVLSLLLETPKTIFKNHLLEIERKHAYLLRSKKQICLEFT